MNHSFKPGQVWLDTYGKPIEAHGGAVWYDEKEDIYYLYGENKDHTDGKCGIWTWGLRYYSSRDLYNWKDEGYLIEPCPEDPEHPMFPENRIDRPHVIQNAEGKMILWIKYSGERACFSIWQADTFTGPYTLVRDKFRPLDKKVGDFDLIRDKNGTVYIFFDSDHAGIMQMELTPDCMEVTGDAIIHRGGLHPPFVREAPALFSRKGKYYLTTSGMTGYLPNPSESAMADKITGPYAVQGNLHPEDETCSSYSSQISQIFKHPKIEDLYIAIADRWVPDYGASREVYESVVRAIASHFEPDQYKASQKDLENLSASPMLASADTSKATYVWLPIRFDGEQPVIDWTDEWRLEDYQ